MENKRSKTIYMITNSIWTFTCLAGALTIKDKYNLSLWIYFIATVIVLATGQLLLKRIFMKTNNK